MLLPACTCRSMILAYVRPCILKPGGMYRKMWLSQSTSPTSQDQAGSLDGPFGILNGLRRPAVRNPVAVCSKLSQPHWRLLGSSYLMHAPCSKYVPTAIKSEQTTPFSRKPWQTGWSGSGIVLEYIIVCYYSIL